MGGTVMGNTVPFSPALGWAEARDKRYSKNEAPKQRFFSIILPALTPRRQKKRKKKPKQSFSPYEGLKNNILLLKRGSGRKNKHQPSLGQPGPAVGNKLSNEQPHKQGSLI